MNISRLLQLLSAVERPELRKPFLETALAVELGYSFPLPSGKVDSIVSHFEQFHADVSKRVIGQLNEMYPFSVNVTYNMVVDVYRNRYTLCHEPQLLSVEDICSQLRRPAFEASVDAVHSEVLKGDVASMMREDLGGYIRRFIVPVDATASNESLSNSQFHAVSEVITAQVVSGWKSINVMCAIDNGVVETRIFACFGDRGKWNLVAPRDSAVNRKLYELLKESVHTDKWNLASFRIESNGSFKMAFENTNGPITREDVSKWEAANL